MGKVSYSAVGLTEKSRSILLSQVGHMIPEGWETIAHHMTIKMGEISVDLERYLGMEVEIRVVAHGITDKAFAVKVEGFPSKNPVPHVTVAIDRNGGAKPFHSKDITDWIPIEKPFPLKGVVAEYDYLQQKVS